MKLPIYLSSVLFFLTFVSQAFAQRAGWENTIYEVRCDGLFYNEPAQVIGVKQYRESRGAGGDTLITHFVGDLYTPRDTGTMRYENGTGELFIGNTHKIIQVENYRGEGMVIKDFISFSVKVLGEFDCQWNLIEQQTSDD